MVWGISGAKQWGALPVLYCAMLHCATLQLGMVVAFLCCAAVRQHRETIVGRSSGSGSSRVLAPAHPRLMLGYSGPLLQNVANQWAMLIKAL